MINCTQFKDKTYYAINKQNQIKEVEIVDVLLSPNGPCAICVNEEDGIFPCLIDRVFATKQEAQEFFKKV